jgi:ABC-type branched-subunit amino acid transport system ATPase component
VITKLSIDHFKAIASATIPLGPITVLVGPNDSGKSTILQALMALSRCGDQAYFGAEQLLECSPTIAATQGDGTSDIEFTAAGTSGGKGQQQSYKYSMSIDALQELISEEYVECDGRRVLSGIDRNGQRLAGWSGESTVLSVVAHDRSSRSPGASADEAMKAAVRAMFVDNICKNNVDAAPICKMIADDLRATLVRLDARAIARPSPLGAPVRPDGSGIVGIVDELLTSGIGDEQISHVNKVIRTLSPHVKTVAARLHPSGGKELHFALRTGTVVPASQVSDGIVLATALVLVSLTSGSRRLLIEEPENGLHPRQLKIVADTIRSIADAQGIQVVLTTHSPLLLNHFAAEEVVLVTRDESGVQATRMSDAEGLENFASEMALGELWYNVGDSNLARPV